LDTEPLHLVLEHGHDVVVHVTDDSGEYVIGGTVTVRHADGPAIWKGDETAPGRHEVNGLPGKEMQFTLQVGGAVYQQDHEAQAGDLTFRIAEHQALVVDWDLPRGRRPGAEYRLVLRSTEDGRSPLMLKMAGTSGQATFSAALPGTYQLSIERHGAGSAAGGDLLVRRPVTHLASGGTRVSIQP